MRNPYISYNSENEFAHKAVETFIREKMGTSPVWTIASEDLETFNILFDAVGFARPTHTVTKVSARLVKEVLPSRILYSVISKDLSTQECSSVEWSMRP